MLLLSLLEDNEEFKILEKLKKINVKDVIYCLVEAWDTIKGAAQKPWKNMWPGLEFVETVLPLVTECELLPLIKKISG